MATQIVAPAAVTIDAAAIVALVKKGQAHRPELATRLEKAASIALFRTLDLVDAATGEWRVESECDRGQFYSVVAQKSCSCQDWARGKAPGGYCKHLLSVALFERAADDAAEAEIAQAMAEVEMGRWLSMATPRAA